MMVHVAGFRLTQHLRDLLATDIYQLMHSYSTDPMSTSVAFVDGRKLLIQTCIWIVTTKVRAS